MLGARAKVREIEGVPSPDTAVSPELSLTDDRDVVLRFRASFQSGSGDVEARFHRVSAFYLGWPNSDILHAHRLGECGLKPWAFQEVENSDWTADMEKRNSRHPRHIPGMCLESRHFIITFNDETFECIAREFEVKHTPHDAHPPRMGGGRQ